MTEKTRGKFTIALSQHPKITIVNILSLLSVFILDLCITLICTHILKTNCLKNKIKVTKHTFYNLFNIQRAFFFMSLDSCAVLHHPDEYSSLKPCPTASFHYRRKGMDFQTSSCFLLFSIVTLGWTFYNQILILRYISRTQNYKAKRHLLQCLILLPTMYGSVLLAFICLSDCDHGKMLSAISAFF